MIDPTNYVDHLITVCVVPPMSSPAAPEPCIEVNHENKVCARCTSAAGTLRCSRCKVTSYCSQDCQKEHWKSGGHKKQCVVNPLAAKLADPESPPLPTFRAYTAEEATTLSHYFVIEAGHCKRKPSCKRDAALQLIHGVGDTPFCVEEDSETGKLTSVSEESSAGMGWTEAAHVNVDGFGIEDSVIFRCLFQPSDKDVETFGETAAEENNVAYAFVNGDVCRGRYVVIKVIKGEERERPRGESENELEDERPPLATETLVPFPVTELADIFLWRTTVGPLYGCSSSRMHRENMRRREMAEYVKLHKQNLMEI